MSRRVWTALLLSALGCGSRAEVAPNTALTPDQHTVNFPINIDGGVHTLDCNVCHGAFDTFSQFSCTSGCHAHDQTPMDAAHIEIVSAYAWSDTACYQCHPAGVVQPGVNCLDGGLPDGGFQLEGCFSHAPFFLIRSGDIHDGCSDDDVYTAVMAKGRNLMTDSAGLALWLLDGGSGVMYPPLDDEGGILCMDCHPDPTNHRSPYLPGSPNAGTGACLSCHPAPGMNAVHDAALGPNSWTPDNTTCLSQGCHKAGGIGL